MTWTEYGILLADGTTAGASGRKVARDQAATLNDMSTDIEAVHQPVQRTVHMTPVDKVHAAVQYGQWSRIPRRSPVDSHFGHSEED